MFKKAIGLLAAVSCSGFIVASCVTDNSTTNTTNESAQLKETPPNIIWFMAEDLSPKLPIYDDHLAHTPNINKIAENGLVFDNAFTTSGVCAPSHASIITGMHSTAIGTHHMRQAPSVIPNPGIPSYHAVPPADVKAFPEYLREAGYWTASYTKTDYQFGNPFTVWDEVSVTPHWRHREDKNQPFFVYFTFEITHEINVWPDWRKQEFFEEHNVNVARLKPDVLVRPPLDAQYVTQPEDVKLPPYYPDTPIIREDVARHYTSVSRMDRQIGELLDDLKEDGLLDSTIVMFTSDHGDGLPRAKRWMYDSGIKVPLVIHVPEKYRDSVNQYVGRTDKLVSAIDYAPTMLTMANVEVPKNMHGINIFNGKPNADREYIFAGRDRMDDKYDMIRAARDKRFKYVKNFNPEKPYTQPLTFMYQMPAMREILRLEKDNKLNEIQSAWLFKTKPQEELYDTFLDPYETNNLAGSHAYQSILLKMRSAMDNWRAEVGDLGELPEIEMAESMWPGGVQPTTKVPEIEFNKSRRELVIKATTEGASLAYRVKATDDDIDDPGTWRLYTKPVTLPISVNRVQVKAVRYGYKASPVKSIKTAP